VHLDFISTHLFAGSQGKLPELRAMLTPHFVVTSSLLGGENIGHGGFDAVVIAADLRTVENISALKKIFPKFKNTLKRIFVIDQKSRLLVFQAYALGATHLLTDPVTQQRLLPTLADRDESGIAPEEASAGTQQVASCGATALAPMSPAVLCGKPIDIADAKHASRRCLAIGPMKLFATCAESWMRRSSLPLRTLHRAVEYRS
jgi:hypothetical protein